MSEPDTHVHAPRTMAAREPLLSGRVALASTGDESAVAGIPLHSDPVAAHAVVRRAGRIDRIGQRATVLVEQPCPGNGPVHVRKFFVPLSMLTRVAPQRGRVRRRPACPMWRQ